MSKWLNYASTLLDSVDSAAKSQLAEEAAKLSATERRERRRANLLSEPSPSSTEGAPPFPEQDFSDSHVSNTRLAQPFGQKAGELSTGEHLMDSLSDASGTGSFVVLTSESGSEEHVELGGQQAILTSRDRPAENTVQLSSEIYSPEKPLSTSAFDFEKKKEAPPNLYQAHASSPPIKRSQDRTAKEMVSEFPELEGQHEKQQIRLLKEEITRREKEIENLNLELEDMEIRLEGQSEELKAAGEAMAHATRKNAAREQELLDEISFIRSAKETDKQNYLLTLKKKDEELSEVRSSLLNAQVEAESGMANIGELNNRIRKLEEDKALLQVEISQAHLVQNQDYGSLRVELRAAEERIEELKDQHASYARSSERRHGALEATNNELTQALAEAQRQLDSRAASFQQLGMQSHATDAEMHALREELHGAQAALELERQHVHSLQREVRQREQEASASRVASQEERHVHERTVRDLKDQIEDKEKEIAKLKSQIHQTSPDMVNVEFERRLKTMTDQLLKKQVQLDEAACERATLNAKLKASFQRAEKAEQMLSEMAHDAGVDIEGGITEDGASARGGVRRRLPGSSPTRSARPISKLDPIAKNPKVAKAVDVIDRLALQAGIVLRNFPEARLGFLLYLLLLHLWALVVLTYNAHNFEVIHADTAGLLNPALHQNPP